jgi:DNA-binding NtrC family response regulator
MKYRQQARWRLPLFDDTPSTPAEISSASFAKNRREMHRPPQILLVDDDEAALLALSDGLRLRFHEAVIGTARTTDAAIELLRSHEYGVIISDIVMPGRDGLAFFKEAQQLRPEVPVILVTGHPDLEEAALYAGAYAFLDKPFTISRLISIVRAALERSHLQRRVREPIEASPSNLHMALFPSPQVL